jgi:energy-converting hydrogenase Eha subunit A
VNCNQARVLLSAHRELKSDDVDTADLDDHLEHCPACREELARSRFIGEQLDGLPMLEPSPDFSAKLMRALAVEHTKYMQGSSASVPPPEFLKPYISAYAQSSQQTDPIVALSTADTGPLPVLPSMPKRRHRPYMGQFAIIGLAAAFLMVIMMGGITSLLLLAQNHTSPNSTTASIIHPTDVIAATYITNTPYDHVMSAVADSTSVYYSAYGDGNNNAYMLERMNRTTKQSMPLLSAPSTSPLIVLGASNGWLVWLQYDPPKPLTYGNVPQVSTSIRTWSLHYLPVASLQSVTTLTPGTPVTLLTGTFDQGMAPNWVFSPIQGIFFMQNTLLVASVDENGLSHLMSYLLVAGANASPSAKSIANTGAGYVITSPTATTDGTQIYWAEEWRGNDSLLHSNIWTQQTFDAPRSTHGVSLQQAVTVKEPFLQDGLSFHPMVVDNALFLLSTASASTLSQEQGQLQTAETPALKASTPVAAATPGTAANTAPWANASVYIPPLDSEIQGTVLMYSLDDAPSAAPTSLSPVDQASSLQAGDNFVLWQNTTGYDMYDAATRSSVTVGQTLDNAQFVAVNGDTTAWTIDSGNNTGTSTNTANSPNPSTTLNVFNWPR